MKIKKVLPYLIVLFLSLQLNIASVASGINYRIYEEALNTFKRGEMEKAGDIFVNTGERLLGEAEEPAILKAAAISFILAASAYQDINQEKAILFWKVAGITFRQLNTDWFQTREEIKSELTALRNKLKNTSGTASSEELLLLELDRFLSFTSFNGIPETSDNTPISFYSRPQLLLQNKPLVELDEGQQSIILDRSLNTFSENPEVTDEKVNQLPVPEIYPTPVNTTETTVKPVKVALTAEELNMGRIAWTYLEKNRQAATGLFDSVKGYPYTTLWDTGSSVAGLVSAEQLGLIPKVRFDSYMQKILQTMASMPLYNNELPNRVYSTRTAKMIGLKENISEKGTGWSALDTGRILIWLKIVSEWYPEYKTRTEAIIKKWKFARLVKNNELYGTYFNGKEEFLRQEGRLGYEQYAAASYRLWNINAPEALDYNTVKIVRVSGVELPYDSRNVPFLTSDPFYLAEIEAGTVNKQFSDITGKVYRAQYNRWKSTGIITAVGEDSLNIYPWFIYNCLYYKNQPWISVSVSGLPFPGARNISTKAALAWSTLFQNEYSTVLQNKVKNLYDEQEGFYAGIYENGRTNYSLNINTNAIILEILLYKKRGFKPFLPASFQK